MKDGQYIGFISDDDAIYWQAYARDIADRMRLKDWDIVIGRDPGDDEVAADARASYGRMALTIRLTDYFLRADPSEQRQTMVHELCHAIDSRIRLLVVNEIKSIEKKWASLLYCTYQSEQEQMIDHFAAIIADSMPLPPERNSNGND